VFQPDLFSPPAAEPKHEHAAQELDLPDLLTLVSMRPRYSFMVLTLIDRIACSRNRSWSRTYSATMSIEACRLCSFILNRLAFYRPASVRNPARSEWPENISGG